MLTPVVADWSTVAELSLTVVLELAVAIGATVAVGTRVVVAGIAEDVGVEAGVTIVSARAAALLEVTEEPTASVTFT